MRAAGLVVLSLLASGCDIDPVLRRIGLERFASPSPSGGVELQVPAASTSTAPWYTAYPPVPSVGKVGDKVWGVTKGPSGRMHFGVFELAAQRDGHGLLASLRGEERYLVPNALMHPVVAWRETRVGSALLASVSDMDPLVSKFAGTSGGEAAVMIDWDGATKTVRAEYVHRIARGTAPFALVMTHGKAATDPRARAGVVVGKTEKHRWVWTLDGKLARHEVGELRALTLATKLRRGSAVMTFDWAGGFRNGTVHDIIEPGVRYGIRHLDRTTSPFFFAQVLSPVSATP